jgi:hypothetical protein
MCDIIIECEIERVYLQVTLKNFVKIEAIASDDQSTHGDLQLSDTRKHKTIYRVIFN